MLILAKEVQVHPDGSCEHMLLLDSSEKFAVKGFPEKKVVIRGRGRGGGRGRGRG